MALVSDILAQKGSDVLTIDGTATVLDAVRMMVDRNVGALLVTERGRTTGIVTERDYLRRVTLEDRDERSAAVSEIATSPFAFVSPETSVDECMALMTEHRLRHLPVLDGGGELAGIVSIGDVVKVQSQAQDVQIRFLTEYISG